MKLNKKLFLIFLLALLLRVYQLGTFPVGFHVDEARVGWNAYSILKTGMDDRGNRFALYYNSFGDYRPTGILYLTIPAIVAFGKTIFAVRFPGALLGALSIYPVFVLTQRLTTNKKKNLSIAYFASFLLAISVWHISVSRATSEVVVALFLELYGLIFFLKGIDTKSRKELTKSVILFLLANIFYHSVRVITPIFVFLALITNIKKTTGFLKPLFLPFSIISLISVVLLISSSGLSRFSQTSIFSDKNILASITSLKTQAKDDSPHFTLLESKPLLFFQSFIKEYSHYFSFDFLINSQAKPVRYATPAIGLLSYTETTLFFIGLIISIKDRKNGLVLLLLIFAPLPAALTSEDAPNLHRALFMIPFLIIIMAQGANFLLVKSNKLFPFLFLIVSFSGILYFWHFYTIQAKYFNSKERDTGAQELALYLNNVQGNYEKILISGDPDSPYPWMAFFNNYDPSIFNPKILDRNSHDVTFENYVFTTQRCPTDKAQDLQKSGLKMLLVDAGGICGEESKQHDFKDKVNAKVLTEIRRPDKTTAYTLWELNP